MTSTRLFVGNLSYNTGNESLTTAFSALGSVSSASVLMDRETGQSRGFGFVEYASASDAQKAVETLNGATLDGRTIVVNVAREREARGGGGFGGGGGGGGGFGGGGGGGRGGGGGGGGRGGDRGGSRDRW